MIKASDQLRSFEHIESDQSSQKDLNIDWFRDSDQLRSFEDIEPDQNTQKDRNIDWFRGFRGGA